MEPFIKHEGMVLPLDRVNVDTDQIIPSMYMKWISRTGYQVGLFHSWRYQEDGSPNPDFILNDPRYQGSTVLVAGRNFGCGSSREHAPWALQQYGFRAIIAPSFADIFRNNCYQIGLLPVELPESVVYQIMRRAQDEPGYRVTVDLESQTVSDEADTLAAFELDPFAKHRLLNGLDDIGLTLQHPDAIEQFETRRPSFLPTTV
jgi:3-isopropylmalate/(R)-2-methylmalate dehydratase small subunit